MKNEQQRLIVKETKEFSVPICTSQFFEKGKFPEQYAIVKLNEDEYRIVELQSFECKASFKKMSQINGECYLLEAEDNNKTVLKIEDKEIFFSEQFQKVLKIFKKYIIVSDLSEKRRLVPLCYYKNLMFEMWPNCPKNGVLNGLDYAIMDLPNGKKTILLAEGFAFSDLEFDSMPYCGNTISAIVFYEDKDEYAIIRIEDLEESKHFENISYIGPYYKPISAEFCQATSSEGKKCLIRVSNFEESKGYDEIEMLSYNYALVRNGKETNILRLSDFVEAQW